jgi:hypothetical protein
MVLCSQVYSIGIRRVYQVLVNVEHDEFTRSMKTIQVVVTGSNRFVNVNLQCKCPEANKVTACLHCMLIITGHNSNHFVLIELYKSG